MFNVILIIIAAVLIYRWLNQKPKNFPPGPPTVPLLGSMPFMNSFHHFELERLKEKYGPIIGFKFGPTPAVAVCSPDLVLEALKRDDFNGRPGLVKRQRKTEGIMFANGTHWKDQRRFTLRHLRDFGYGKKVMGDMVEAEVNEFCAAKLKGKSEVQVSGLFNTCAINILWEMIAGSRMSYEDPNFNDLLHHLQLTFRSGNLAGGVNSIPYLRQLISLFYELESTRTDRMLHNLFMRALNEHRATKTDSPRDFLDVYIDELDNPSRKESFTVDVLMEVLRDLFAAGTESSSNTVSFAILYLIHYPEWQEKLIDQIDQVLGTQPPSVEDKIRLPLVEAFLAESQRCNTIAPLSVPHATTEDTTLGGYNLPKDTFVHLSIWCLLQDKKHWGDPESFRPQRFLDQDGKLVKDPYMILFGTGSRLCPGEPLARNFAFLFFVSLLQRYRFTQPKGTPLPTTACQFGFTTAPTDFTVVLNPRN